MTQAIPAERAKRIVIKVGSSLLANSDHLTPRFGFIHGLMSDIAALKARGYEVVLASSGAVALGLKVLGLTAEEAGIQDKQAAAACGQPLLLNVYKQIASEHGLDIAQVLVTLDDLEEQRRFLNTKNTVHRLLERNILPIVNENDTVTTEEIRVGDNDRLAARVGQMIRAQTFVILTSIDGLYDRPPSDKDAQFVPVVEDVTGYLAVTSETGALGTGGMLTKMQAANMAQNANCTTYIGRGVPDQPVTAILDGTRRATRCVAHKTVKPWWEIWLTDRLQMAGSLVLKQQVADALKDGDEGLSCHDVVSFHSDFAKADVLHIYDEQGVERARGMSNLSSEEAALIARNPGQAVQELLGYKVSGTLINANNLVLLEERHIPWDEPDGDDDQLLIATSATRC